MDKKKYSHECILQHMKKGTSVQRKQLYTISTLHKRGTVQTEATGDEQLRNVPHKSTNN